jgi:hypothetical protein
MKNLKKNLRSVNRDIKSLAKKVEKMIVAVGKLEKPKLIKAYYHHRTKFNKNVTIAVEL